MNKLFIFFISSFLFLISTASSAVEYKLPDVNGNIQSLEQYKGKWVVVNYWATWCGSCIKELPDLAKLHEENIDSNIVVIGINYETINKTQLKGFVGAYEIPYPVWLSEEVRETPLGVVPVLPTTYIVDPEGNVVAGEAGVITKQALEAYISKQMLLEKYVKYNSKQNS
ncbi:MAG: hypothetical protein DIZ80_15195 [endosymbiont of Galathealinum brachiosum]|uniref:Thioredoxin domain-containing protein n=1 Tax=endosymbiont of Galathealinum brachiosum TaxID=2200906 RepID=A0A370D969_9GAMM|nr:MAG: hypothetical protein DIZ80_15195 [endosymbiont of Galathealinum brachiosum]